MAVGTLTGMSVNSSKRRLITVIVAVAIVVAFVLLGNMVRVPYVALSPGLTVNTLGEVDGKQVVQVDGAVDPNPAGHLNLTTVSVTDGLSLFDALGLWLTGRGQLQPRELYFPRGTTAEQMREENKQQMMGSEQDATGAALTYLQRPTVPGVGGIANNSPAKGKLELGDILLAVDGQSLGTVDAFVNAVRSRKPGDTVALTIKRKDVEQVVDVTLAARPDEADQGYLGVTASVFNADPNVKIIYNVGDIGGPSAGLMLSLAVVDRLTPGDLADGKFIAGTGTITPDGKVGRIGGITHKLEGARADGATVFLVPADNCAEALTDVPDGLELIKVENLGGAVAALTAVQNGTARPHCG